MCQTHARLPFPPLVAIALVVRGPRCDHLRVRNGEGDRFRLISGRTGRSRAVDLSSSTRLWRTVVWRRRWSFLSLCLPSISLLLANESYGPCRTLSPRIISLLDHLAYN
uniref:Uncharacterized protein n=1 Tax=Arundo donax TaxID=35708 RepID=A0A0A9E7T5_ARUDO